MDWSKITAELNTARTLDAEALEQHLARLGNTSPDIAGELREIIGRRRLGQSFMQTSVDGADIRARSVLPEGEAVGVWTVRGLIGAGGMGEVYRADRSDGRYDQTVALKLMQLGGELDRRRFEQERRRLASLDHPGIARIIDGGEGPGNRPFMAMEYVEGAPIDRHVRTARLGRRDTIRLFLQLCAAVEHAHNRLVLHRDIKPDNILVDDQGQVRLIDFGVASLLDSDDDSAAGPLTVAFAAPEQLKRERLSAATDIFALGMVLHTLLTGAPPARLPDGGVQIDRAALGARELAAIADRMTRTDPAERYASASAVAEDLRAFLDKRPVDAYRTGGLYRTTKALSRYPLASGLAAAFVAALVAGLAATTHQTLQANRQRDRAEAALEDARWQSGRAGAMLSAQQAYGDLLYKAFGEQDTEALTTKLLEEWQAAYDNRAGDPERAAALSLALFRSFYSRGDYPSAQKVADAWFAEDFGSDEILEAGKEMYGNFLFDSRDYDAALPYLRDTLATFEARHRPAFDRSATALRIASVTGDAGDIEKAKRYALENLAGANAPEQLVEGHGMLGEVLGLAGDDAGAFAQIVQAHDVFTQHPDFISPLRANLRIRLAGTELQQHHDPESARDYAARCAGQDTADLGENELIGQCFGILAMAQLELGEYDEAAGNLDTAAGLMARYGGAPTEGYPGIRTVRAEILARQGRMDAAYAELDAVAAMLADRPENDPSRLNVAVTRLIVDLLNGTGPDDIRGRLAALPPEDLRNPRITYLHGRLLNMLAS